VIAAAAVVVVVVDDDIDADAEDLVDQKKILIPFDVSTIGFRAEKKVMERRN
jgi:hypothetical protein